MTDDGRGWSALSAAQRRSVQGWLPGAVVEADLSWGLVDAVGGRRVRLCEAVGTAVWAHQVGDRPFEQEGLRLLAELTAPGS